MLKQRNLFSYGVEIGIHDQQSLIFLVQSNVRLVQLHQITIEVADDIFESFYFALQKNQPFVFFFN
jgi:hypothetical protein